MKDEELKHIDVPVRLETAIFRRYERAARMAGVGTHTAIAVAIALSIVAYHEAAQAGPRPIGPIGARKAAKKK